MRKPSELATFERNSKNGFTVYLMVDGTKIKYKDCKTLDEVTNALNSITFSLTGYSAKDYAEQQR